MASQKINKNERYMLKGRLRKEGFDLWRLVTSGKSVSTGEERVFFIEFYILNPSISPDEPVLGFKSRSNVSEEDLHSALAGTVAASQIEAEKYIVPSFVMVKAGIFRENGKQINNYFPSSNIQFSNNELILKVGTDESNFCSLTTSSTYGKVSVTKENLDEYPELLCHDGTMSWNLRYNTEIDFKGFKSKEQCWSVPGGKTTFEGKINLDGEDYEILPETSNGYFETCWGKNHFQQYYHLSSSKLSSLNTGKALNNSCFVVHGICDDVISVYLSIEGRKYTFALGKAKKSDLTFEFSEMPEKEEGNVRFHWTVSISDSRYVIDIDGYCNDKSMFLRDYECPEGARKVLRIAGSGNGTGELKVFRKIKKTLEQIEYIGLENMLCEYGGIESPEV